MCCVLIYKKKRAVIFYYNVAIKYLANNSVVRLVYNYLRLRPLCYAAKIVCLCFLEATEKINRG